MQRALKTFVEREKEKSCDMLVLGLVAKKSCVKYHIAWSFTLDLTELGYWCKNSVYLKKTTLERKKWKWALKKNLRQVFFSPPTNWKWRNPLYHVWLSLCPQIFIEGQRQRCLMGYDYVKWSEKQCFITANTFYSDSVLCSLKRLTAAFPLVSMAQSRKIICYSRNT